MPSFDTGRALWASLPKGWIIGLRRRSLTFACSETCAKEIDELDARAAKVSAPILKALGSA